MRLLTSNACTFPVTPEGVTVSVLDLNNIAVIRVSRRSVQAILGKDSNIACISLNDVNFRLSFRRTTRSSRLGSDEQTLPSGLADMIRCHRTASRRMVGRGGLEPPTSRLSGVRSNHLSYRPEPARRSAGLARRAPGGASRSCTQDRQSERR